MNSKKQNRSKYNFGSYKLGQEVLIDPMDLHSMASSLGAFNKRHGRNIVVEPTGQLSEEGKVKCIVNQI